MTVIIGPRPSKTRQAEAIFLLTSPQRGPTLATAGSAQVFSNPSAPFPAAQWAQRAQNREKPMRRTTLALVLFGIAMSAPRTAHAIPSFTVFTTLASFQAALGGAPTFTQDFEGFADGTNLFGVPILPGVTASTNGSTLEVFNSVSIGNTMFGFPRTGSEFYYDVFLGTPYNAIAFDIQAFDPATGDGRLDVIFADASSTFFSIGPGATETTPVFFGIIAGGAIASLRWNEPPELSGDCCEETGLDNFVVGTATVPEPSTLLLLALGLGALRIGRKQV